MDHKKIINKAYLDILGRFADDCGLHTYSRKLYFNEIDESKLREILINSDEYKKKFDNNRDSQFIDLVQQLQLTNCKFSTKCYKSVVFIEGRQLSYVKYILCQANKYLQNDWGILFITTKESLKFYIEEFVLIENIRFKIVDSLENVQEYNDLLVSLYFWKVLLKGISHAFIMQSDSLLIKPIDESWLNYDYIGAATPCGTTMNGGFCIRNVQSMIDCLYDKFTEENIEEDKYFTKMLRKLEGKNLPDYNMQLKFSWESVCGSELPSGFHKLWNHKPREFLKIKNYVLSQTNKT